MTEQTVPGRLAVKMVFVASIILLSLYLVNLLLGALGEEAPGVDFVVYKAYYNSTEGSVTAWVDHNGTIRRSTSMCSWTGGLSGPSAG